MRKTLFPVVLFLSSFTMIAQELPAPYSFNNDLNETAPILVMPAHDFGKDIADAEAFEKNGNYPRVAKHFEVNRTLFNSGIWTQLTNGDRVWRLSLKSSGALYTRLFFNNSFIPKGATLHVYSDDHTDKAGYTVENNQGNGLFSTRFIKGEQQTIEYYEPVSVKGQGRFFITSLAHQYRSVMADPCEVNINCSPEGNNWQDEKRGVVHIYVVAGGQGGYCSGSLINNTALDCKRYILTAFHCGETSTTAEFNQWEFYFNCNSRLN